MIMKYDVGERFALSGLTWLNGSNPLITSMTKINGDGTRARFFSREARAGQLLVRTNLYLSENGSGACDACVHNYILLHTRSCILCFRLQRSVRSLNDTPRGDRLPPA